MGPRKWSPWRTATARAPRAGRAMLRDLKHRGMRAPVLAIGDGALGFWAAVREVWPATAEQRCWVHRIAKQALHAMLYAETRVACEREMRRFTAEYGAKYPKAVAALTTEPRAAADPVRLPRGALEAPADHQLDRVHVRDGPAA